jgi:sporulation protein YlmC with PRC-barrel domain
MRTFVVAAVASAFALSAAAQEQQAAQYTKIEDESTMVEAFGLSVDELDDMDVVGADSETIGEVEDVLADASGSIVAVAVETEGFLGLGDEDVIVTLDQLQLGDGRLATTLTEEQLEALPTWDD